MSNPLTRSLRTRNALTLSGAMLILVSGLIHLVLTPEHFEENAYLGWLFIADFAGTLVAASGIYQERRWGWTLGGLVAFGAFVAYFVDEEVGLPGVEGHHSLELVGIITKVVEALFLVLCAFKLTESFTGVGRWVLVSGSAAALLVPGLAVTLGLLGSAAHAEPSCASS